MKFRTIFAVFNIIIVVSFLLIFLMPYFVLGWEYTELFWRNNWFLGIIFVAILGALNGYFVHNWRLFSLLEQEDWPNLIAYLEARVFEKGRTNKQRMRILINAYVVTSQPDRTMRLEQYLRENKPAVIPQFALQLGIPYLLRNDPEAMEQFYGEMKEESNCADPLWVRWNYAFALMLQQKLDDAKAVLLSIAPQEKNPVLRLLTLYLLDAFTSTDEEVRQVVRNGTEQLRAKYPGEKWQAQLERRRDSLQVLVLSKLIRDATEWAFGSGRKTGSEQSSS